MPLTDAAIKSAKPREDGKHLKLTDGQGLSLWIMPTGAKYWRLKYRINGKEKLLALGVYPEVSLKEARLKRDDARKQITDGEDPAAMRKMDKVIKLAAANTFEAIALEWHERESHEWSTAHSERVLSAMKSHIFPYIGDKPINDIRPLELLEVLRKVESAGNIDTTKRLRQRCSAVFRLAILTGRCDSDPAAPPLTDALKSQQSTPRKALMREDIPSFLEALEKYDGNLQTKLMMKLMLLTFTRVGEMAMARWEEIDFDKALWTIPPEHRKLPEKSKKFAPPHLVPLSMQALEVLRQLYAISGGREHIFPNRNSPRRHMSPETLRRALHRMGFRGKADVHGFRSTASTILNEEGFNPDAIERQLSHIETNKVRSAYNRAEYIKERKTMMRWWANYLYNKVKL